jgi:hypothetical protein
MSNEKFLEEILYSAHRSGVFSQFMEEIDSKIKSGASITTYDAAPQVYYDFKNRGLIQD